MTGDKKLLRWATSDDASELAQVFFAAVREGPSLYSEAQRAAWLPEPPHGDSWHDRIAAVDVALIDTGERIAGFMSLDADGYIDLAFVRPEYQGSGLFRVLFDAVEMRARSQGARHLWTHASLMAQPAFRAVGFLGIHHEKVERDGQFLSRAKMEKSLT